MNLCTLLHPNLILMATLNLVVRAKPLLTIMPPVVWEGSATPVQVTLTCAPGPIAGDFNVTWLKDTTEYSLTRTDLTLTLQTYSVATEDGTWKCQITDDSGSTTSDEQTLTINSYPVNTPQLQPISVNVVDGAKIADCVYVSKPNNTLEWRMRNDDPLPDILTTADSGKLQAKYTVRTSTLSWKLGVTDLRKTEINKQLFKCVSSISGVANSMRTGYLDVTVLYKPVAIELSGGLTTETVTEGSQVSRKCQAECNPACTYIWRGSSLGRLISQTQRLELLNVTQHSAQVYTCTAENEHGLLHTRFNLTVEYAPVSMQMSYTPRTPIQGNNVTVTCSVDSHPGSVISLHNTSSDTPALAEQTDVTRTQHTILDITCHTIEIWCRAHNQVNYRLSKPHLTSNIQIVTRCAPQVYYTNVDSEVGLLTISREKSAEILVGLLASPFPSLAETRWTFSSDAEDGPEGDREDRLPDNARVGAVDGNILSLTILEAGTQNVGQYTLTAWNDIGEVNVTVALVVKDDLNYPLVIGSAAGGGVVLIFLIIIVVLLARNVIPKDCQRDQKQTRKDTDEPNATPVSPVRRTNNYQEHGLSAMIPQTSETHRATQRHTMDVQDAETLDPIEQALYVNSNQIQGPTSRLVNQPVSMADKLKEALAARSKPVVAHKPKAVKGVNNMKTLQTKDIALKELLVRGKFFNVHRCEAWRSSQIPSDDHLVAKQACETSGPMGNIYWDFLRSQAETLLRLRDTGQVVHCYGIIYEPRQRLMIMSRAMKGSVRDYLKSRDFRQSSEQRKTNELLDIVHQTVSGLVAISNLQASEPVLHYCLNADHVLMTEGNVCQVTGFASGTIVQSRETWEHENNHARPLRWLAPEAVELNHVVESDVWSLGVLMWEIYSLGQIPHGPVRDDGVAAVVTSGTRLKKPVKCSKEMYNLMLRCWWMDTKQRAKLSDIYSELPCPSQDYMDMANHRLYANVDT